MVIKAGVVYKYNSPLLWWRPRWTPYVYTLTAVDLQACDVHSGKVVAVVPLADCRLTHWCTKPARDIEWSDAERSHQKSDEGLLWRLRLEHPKKPWATVHLAVATERDWLEWIQALGAIPSVATPGKEAASTASSSASSVARRSSSCKNDRATISGGRSSTVLLKSTINHSLEQYTPAQSRAPNSRRSRSTKYP